MGSCNSKSHDDEIKTIINARRKSNQKFITNLLSNEVVESDEDLNDEENQMFNDNGEKISGNDKLSYFCDKVNEFINGIKNDNCIDGTISNVSVPRIVLVGTQSSGKSSFLNNVIGYELLPTGDNMITRTPIYIRMYKTEHNNQHASIITYEHNEKIMHYKTTLINDTVEDRFHEELAKVTKRIVGKKDDISPIPIYIDVYLSNGMNLTLVDLPGIILVPKTDKGQSEDLADNIDKLIEDELMKPHSYVINCIEAKLDLETDIGLSLLKKIKKTNKNIKTISLFTKIDKMDKDKLRKFDQILGGELSKDLQADDGYYVVNNNIMNNNVKWYYDYIGGNKNIIQNRRYGIQNMKVHLKRKITNEIRKSIPNIKNDLIKYKNFLKSKSPMLDDELEDQTSKTLYITINAYILNQMLVQSINADGNIHNIGSDIGIIFDTFINETSELDPFSKENFSDEKLNNIMKSFHGYLPKNKMTADIVVNRCLADETVQPVKKIIEYVKKCTEKIKTLILDLEEEFLDLEKLDLYPQEINTYKTSIQSFPRLKVFLLNSTQEIMDVFEKETIQTLKKYLAVEERHIWLDEPDIEILEKNDNDIHHLNIKTDEDNEIIGSKPFFGIKNVQQEMQNYKFPNDGGEIFNVNTADTNSTKTSTPKKRKMSMCDININIDGGDKTITIDNLRYLTKLCYNEIIESSQIKAKKTIIAILLNGLEENFFIEIIKKMIVHENIDNLFYENEEEAKRKIQYKNYINGIDDLLKQISNFYSATF